MEDIAGKAKLISGHKWSELKSMIDNRTYEPQPQVYSIKTVASPETPKVLLSATPRTQHFIPNNVRRQIVEWFEHFHPAPNPNRGRLSGSAPSLTFGAQKGRGSDRNCVIKRTLDHSFRPLMTLVHELAQNAVAPMLPYLGFQILRLGVGQSLNQHRDYHKHPDYPNHTMKFGKYMGGSLQMLRDGQWYSYDTENQWLSFDALKVVHKVTPTMTKGERLYTPGKLDRLTAQDWDYLAKAGFPIHLYKPPPAKMRRLTTPLHVMTLTPESKQVQETLANGRADQPHYHHRSYDALISHLLENDEHFWTNIPVPGVADPNDTNLLRPKTLLDCCQCAQDFLDEYDLSDGYDEGTLYLMRVSGHRSACSLNQFQRGMIVIVTSGL